MNGVYVYPLLVYSPLGEYLFRGKLLWREAMLTLTRKLGIELTVSEDTSIEKIIRASESARSLYLFFYPWGDLETRTSCFRKLYLCVFPGRQPRTPRGRCMYMILEVLEAGHLA